MTPSSDAPLRAFVAGAAGSGAVLWDGRRRARLKAAASAQPPGALEGASVLIRAEDQLDAALALILLDGFAARLVLAPPDLDDAHLEAVLEGAEVEAVVRAADEAGLAFDVLPGRRRPRPARAPTEWVLFTSGTSGPPKMAVHRFSGLRPAPPAPATAPPVWATFYDIRRYGGLQMLLRACLAGASMALGRRDEGLGGFLVRAGSLGVTHLAGTPSHWRSALLAPELAAVDPGYVRLSGEIVDQAILDRLSARFPKARIGHAFASTEAGVGFEVEDGLEGFPAAFLERTPPHPELRLRDGVLEIRSPRTALGYLPSGGLRGPDGFVSTGDLVEKAGERCRFLGRKDGVVNVGGLKTHPEEVERIINRVPGVRAALVFSRKNPVTGAVVAAEVVPDASEDTEILRDRILVACRGTLAPHKVPATLRFVETLGLSPAGKLARRGA